MFLRSPQGQGDIHPNVKHLKHPAAVLLSHFGTVGTPVVILLAPWSLLQINGALAQGPHQSTKQGIDFLQEEFADMIEKQQWIMLPAAIVMHLPGLCLSPLGLVPQQDCCDRMILDYSYFGINVETLELAPKEAMHFGRALWRLLFCICRANLRFGPVYISKINLSNGFYRLWLAPSDTTSCPLPF